MSRLTVFHGLRPPPISVEAYLERIAKYTKCSPVCFIMALSYMDVLGAKDSNLKPTSLNIHRLILTCVMLAAKFFDDHYFNNAFFAKVGQGMADPPNAAAHALLCLAPVSRPDCGCTRSLSTAGWGDHVLGAEPAGAGDASADG